MQPVDTNKHFFDFNPTEEELQELDGLPLDDKRKAFYERIKGTDGEKFRIASLMHLRGHPIIAKRWIMAIEEPKYRQDMLMIYASWNLPEGAVR